MYGLEKVAEILHHAFEEKYAGKDVAPEGYDESCKKFLSTLSDKQYKLFLEYDLNNAELQIAEERLAIQYILELMCPEC